MRDDDLRYVLFCAEVPLGRAALAAGIDALLVDWEWRDKHRRQVDADTEINGHGPAELRAMAGLSPPALCCRVNGPDSGFEEDVDRALEAGATDVFLPMVRGPLEVERFLSRLDGRARAGILVETVDACRAAADLASLPLDWVYMGLNDLAIERESRSLFEAVVDGTVERVRETFGEVPFGFGGVTVVGGGEPVPGRLLLAEMARLGCAFSFLRRSFTRDVAGRDLTAEVARMREAWRALRGRSESAVGEDRRALEARVEELLSG